MRPQNRILIVCFLFAILGYSGFSQNKKALTITDMMKFRQIASPAISNDGNWVVHVAKPDRGDAEVLIYSTDGKEKYSIERGTRPQISGDGKWVAAIQDLPAEDQLKKQKDPKPKQSLVLLNTSTGEQQTIEKVQSFSFSNDGHWLVYQNYKEEDKKVSAQGDEDFMLQEKEEKQVKKKKTGTVMNVLHLVDQKMFSFEFVKNYSMDSSSHYLAYVVADTLGAGNGVFVKDLSVADSEPEALIKQKDLDAVSMTWNNRKGHLAFLGGTMNKKEELEKAELYLWTPGTSMANKVLANEDLKKGWLIFPENQLRWSTDGQRLFLGIKPETEIAKVNEESDSVPDLFDINAILDKKEMDVWHWNDPLINSQQKKVWNRVKNRIYTGVFYPESGSYIPLADEEMPDLWISQSIGNLLGSSSIPYMKELTWFGRKSDYYLVDINTGKRKKVLTAHDGSVELSPDGKQLIFYKKGNWHLLDIENEKEYNLTQNLEVPFYDEDHDYPSPVPGYGIAGWTTGSKTVFINDKYDIWEFPTNGAAPTCVTKGKGREEKMIFRIRELDRSRQFYSPGDEVFLTAYHDLKKHTAIYSMTIGKSGTEKLVEEDKKYTLLAKAKNDLKFLFTRQTYTEFPDLWITDSKFKKQLKLTDVNPQVKDFAWGAAELVEWTNMDGVAMQGVLIKPGNYEPGKKYPVLVYYYRFFSQRLYDFNQVVINHRPCFPFYASNGYAVFLPDIRFDIGNPGYAATKCLIPGMQKIIDMGIADPKAIGLHGHSWSGYQTAFVITQTNLFACAIAGAPVSNMTSAYSGIRWQSGMARQFQYEQSQSRIGGSLWEYPERYIENSPVFFADRIKTPLLIMFGDEDGAVPWYQGIELYLAMRRLEKDCVFLQYRGEPHHLQKYPNKVDYTIKMKEYLDHYLKGEPAADWIKKGVLYNGR